MTKFVSSIPADDVWETHRKNCGFEDGTSNRLAIQLLLGIPAKSHPALGSTEVKVPALSSQDDPDMIQRACKFGHQLVNYSANKRFVILVSKYQKLVFICYCIVLLADGNSKETVNWMMREYISDSNDKNLERYRLGGMWVNRSIVRLLSQGWGYKSWELFMLCSFMPSLPRFELC